MKENNIKAALDRCQKFENILSEVEAGDVYSLLKVDTGGYYKIVIKCDTTITIVEILNKELYSVDTTVNYVELEVSEATLYYKAPCSGAISLFVDFFDSFEITATPNSQVEFDKQFYNTETTYLKSIKSLNSSVSMDKVMADTFIINSKSENSSIEVAESAKIKFGNWVIIQDKETSTISISYNNTGEGSTSEGE